MKKGLLAALALLLALFCACTGKDSREKEAQPLAAATAENPVLPDADAPAESGEDLAHDAPAVEEPEVAEVIVFDETPALSETAITADGAQLARVYEKDDVLLVSLRDVADAFGGVYAAEDDGCTARFGQWTVEASSEGAYLLPSGARAARAEEVTFDGTDWFVPARDLLMLTGRTEFFDAQETHLYYTTIPDAGEIAEGLAIPVLMYHAVSDEMWGYWDLFVSPKDFEAHLQYLQENGYTTVTFEDLPYLTAEDKPVMLTFDDGYGDNYTELFPLLEKYQAKATVFCITGSIGNEHMLTAEQIKELSDSGLVSIQSHTVTHPFLASSTQEEIARECEQSRLELLRITGKLPFVLCYPTGSVSEKGIETIADYYDFGLLMNGGTYFTGRDAYRVPRFYVARGMSAGDISYYLNVG